MAGLDQKVESVPNYQSKYQTDHNRRPRPLEARLCQPPKLKPRPKKRRYEKHKAEDVDNAQGTQEQSTKKITYKVGGCVPEVKRQSPVKRQRCCHPTGGECEIANKAGQC